MNDEAISRLLRSLHSLAMTSLNVDKFRIFIFFLSMKRFDSNKIQALTFG